ncbi:MAG: MoxR family ATPase [Ruminococcaceae bacterium]|nr:MoxR family ATPase [Oscillospiraceae bacterium]
MENAYLLAEKLENNISSVIYGKRDKIKLIITALFARGHILLDDIPGTGKTMLAKSLALSVNADYKRIQFTPDLLPSDICGINFFNMKESEFVFRKGPVFTNILLADEINRTTPRTQSALLECMAEFQATIDGVSYPLDELFFVIATQNPIESQGTFPLPEAQTDRFIMRLSMGYPDRASEKEILDKHASVSPIESLEAVCSKEDVILAAKALDEVNVSDSVKDYIIALAEASRTSERIRLGISPRASLALMRAAKGYALISGRDYVIPDDVKHVAIPVMAHRIIPRSTHSLRSSDSSQTIIEYLLDSTPVPLS